MCKPELKVSFCHLSAATQLTQTKIPLDRKWQLRSLGFRDARLQALWSGMGGGLHLGGRPRYHAAWHLRPAKGCGRESLGRGRSPARGSLWSSRPGAPASGRGSAAGWRGRRSSGVLAFLMPDYNRYSASA